MEQTLLLSTRMQLFMDQKVATNHWKQDWFTEAALQLSSAGLGQDTRMKTFTSSLMSLIAGLHFTSHHPVNLPPGVYPDPVLISWWGVTHLVPGKGWEGRQWMPSTVTQIRTRGSALAMACLRAQEKGMGLLSAGNRAGKNPLSGGFTLLHRQM